MKEGREENVKCSSVATGHCTSLYNCPLPQSALVMLPQSLGSCTAVDPAECREKVAREVGQLKSQTRQVEGGKAVQDHSPWPATTQDALRQEDQMGPRM